LNGYVIEKRVIADQKFYMKQGLVKNAMDVNKLIDNSYVENALKVLGKYKK